MELARICQMGLSLAVDDLAPVSSTHIGLGPNARVQVSARDRNARRAGWPDRTPRQAAGHEPTAALRASVLMWPSRLCGAGPSNRPFLRTGHWSTPHKLSGSGARRKRTKLASSFHGVAAGLAIDSRVGPGIGSDLSIASRVQVVVAGDTCPGHARRFESVRRWLCGVPDRERAESWASTGWRPHNQLGHIRTVMWSTT